MRRYGTEDHVVRDAEALAAAADDFHRAVEGRESSDDPKAAFDVEGAFKYRDTRHG